MKKIVSLLLVLTLVMSLAIPAFAEENTATTGRNSSQMLLTTVVPEVSFTMVLPATVEIPYGETTYVIADPKVTNVTRFNPNDTVWMTAEWGNYLVSDNYSIPLEVFYGRFDDGNLEQPVVMLQNPTVASAEQIAYKHGEEVQLVYWSHITDAYWADALPGEYTGCVNFTYWYVPAEA